MKQNIMPSNASTPMHITRVCNACCLIRIGEHFVLTDPYFVNKPIFRVQEEVGLAPRDLPPLSAIIGGHDVADHWQMDGLSEYPHDKNDVRVFVAMEPQASSARKAGFRNVEVVAWGEERTVGSNLSLEVVEGQKMLGWTVNNYVLRTGDASIFFGSEARDLEPLKAYGEQRAPVNVAALPVNSVHMFGFKLVMSGREAVQGAKHVGAKSLFVIHDAHAGFFGLMRIESSGDDAEAAAREEEDLEVVRVRPGVEWTAK